MKTDIAARNIFICLCFLFSTQLTDAQTAKDYYNTGYNFYKNRQYEKAIQSLSQALKMDPEYVYAYQVRGNVYYAMKDYDNAFYDYSDAVDLGCLQ
jgi:Tfp pilus assembly protein PilF